MSYALLHLPRNQPFASGVFMPGARLRAYLTGTTTPTPLYSDSALTTAVTQPVIADATGTFQELYLRTDIVYKITLSTSADVLVYSVDPANDLLIDQAAIGLSLYPRTAAEIAAGVTPTYYYYPPGDVRRYGAVIDGSTDDRPAIMRAYSQWKSGGARIYCPPGTSFISQDGANAWSLLFDDDVYVVGEGFTLLASDSAYNHIRFNGTNINVFMRGITFDHGASSITPASTDHICLRFEGSVNTIRLEDLDLQNYHADGIYFRSDVNGPGGYIENVTSNDGGRSLITIAKGEKLKIRNCTANDIGLQGFVTAPTDNTTICRNIDFIDCNVLGGGNYGGSFSTTDRAGFFISGVSGASASIQSGIRVINGRAYDYGNSAPGTVPLAMGIETREIFGPVVDGFIARSCRDVGVYSYLTDGAVYSNNHCTGNIRGLWMNACTRYSEYSNTCLDNSTANRDYNGPDGDSPFVNADGMWLVIGRGSVSFSGGTPSLNSAYNVTIDSDLGVGDVRFAFITQPGDADYSVVACFRSHSGTSGLIQSASHSTSTFRVVTFNAGAAADESYDFVVLGIPTLTTEPV